MRPPRLKMRIRLALAQSLRRRRLALTRGFKPARRSLRQRVRPSSRLGLVRVAAAALAASGPAGTPASGSARASRASAVASLVAVDVPRLRVRHRGFALLFRRARGALVSRRRRLRLLRLWRNRRRNPSRRNPGGRNPRRARVPVQHHRQRQLIGGGLHRRARSRGGGQRRVRLRRRSARPARERRPDVSRASAHARVWRRSGAVAPTLRRRSCEHRVE